MTLSTDLESQHFEISASAVCVQPLIVTNPLLTSLTSAISRVYSSYLSQKHVFAQTRILIKFLHPISFRTVPSHTDFEYLARYFGCISAFNGQYPATNQIHWKLQLSFCFKLWCCFITILLNRHDNYVHKKIGHCNFVFTAICACK